MKYLILLLFTLMSFGQWEYKEVIDSVENDNYSIANNKNLSMVHVQEGLTLGVQVESDKHVRDGYMNVRLVFITDTNEYSYITTCKCYKGYVTITSSLHTQQYFRFIQIAKKVEVHLQVKTNVMWLPYHYDSNNFKEAYDFLIQH